MKVGSVVLGLHVAVLCVFSLTQGCVTNEASGNRVAGARRNKGAWNHVHKGKRASVAVAQPEFGFDQGMGEDTTPLFDSPIIDGTDMGATPEPYPTPAPAPTSSGTDVYIVKKGDILGQIAVDFDTTTKSLVAMNNLANPDVLYVGQELRVPAGRSTSPATTRKSSGTVKKGGSYEIQKGDTLSEIALAAGVGIDDLRSLNNITDDKIFAGETIYIPSYGKVPSTTRKAAPKKKAAPAPAPAPVEPAPEPAVAEPAPAPLAFAPTEVEPVQAETLTVGVIEDKVLYPGETLDDVARQYGVSKAEIMRLNNISDETQVREGQRLRVPISE